MSAIALQPKVLKWARERARLSKQALAKKMKVPIEKVEQWESVGELTFKNAEKLAHSTHTPFGFLFLTTPPDDRLPIQDFRTIADKPVLNPSPDLLETVQAMQRRQEWMRSFLIEEGDAPLDFVGKFSAESNPRVIAENMRQQLGLSIDWARALPSWEEALRHLREKADEAGVLVVINGVVGNNGHRKLDPKEFRGFALLDSYAPLIFINGSDATVAKIFTFAHELAHIWIGLGGVSNPDPLQQSTIESELLCNRIAAEFLMPSDILNLTWEEAKNAPEPFQFLARRFKVGVLVAARRALDENLISKSIFFKFLDEYEEDPRRTNVKTASGGDFWNTQNVRLGRRFGTAVVLATLQGRLLYRDAYRLTGLQGKTFAEFAQRQGFKI